MNDPERHAETIRTAYQNYLEGRAGISAKSVAARLQPDSAGVDTLTGMRGPYLQALPVANWSERDWTTFAREQSLHPNVTRAFREEGFRRLYDFQERSVETILDGENTVISAATGRGKTEAWLIPILDQIVKNKRSVEADGRTSTKALLLYPTKALAQDQFKRLVQILYRINRNLRQKEWVTIGIYDGDTPRHVYEDEAQGYLNRTFEHFDCPGCNDDLQKCQTCGQGVFVERTTNDFKLRPDKPECEDDEAHPVPLDFVRMTRSGLMNNGADIVLTNPDTLNYRLFNINAETEHRTFVDDPDFLVFDEVHTYDGLLGSYTATLVKRLRQRRQRQGLDSLQVIGSSATVDNDVELFRQISGADSVRSVEEDPRELSGTPPSEIPESLYSDGFTAEDLLNAGRGRGRLSQLQSIDLTVENRRDLDNERIRDRVSENLFDALTDEESDDSVTRTVQTLHEELHDDPRPPDEFRNWVGDRFGLTEEQAEQLVDNFQTIGQFSGLLETRHHLFSWPLDGFYACAGCDSVYRSPQDTCSTCASEFVTRATYCQQCDEEYLVAYACSRCEQLVPYVHTEEGLISGDDDRACPYCDAARDVTSPLHVAVFQSVQECTVCGDHRDRAVTETCESCGTRGVPASDGNFECRNPACGRRWERTSACEACGSDDWTVGTANAQIDCLNCGLPHDPSHLPRDCECGESVTDTRLLPWNCTNCGRRQLDHEPPTRCDCGSSEGFVKAGLFDLAAIVECDNCGETHVPGGECSCDDPAPVTTQNTGRRYKSWDDDSTVVSPLEHEAAIPCDHDLWSSVVGDAFSELMRSPTNVSVTTSQYLLRTVSETEGFESAKLLAFSDSHSDMKDLDRSFTEPEVDTALDQLVLCALELCRAGVDPSALSSDDLGELNPGGETGSDSDGVTWIRLSSVVDTADELIDALETELSGSNRAARTGVDLRETILGTSHVYDERAAVRERLKRRAIRTVGEGGTLGHGSLEAEGLLDVRLRSDAITSSTDNRRRALTALVEAGDGVERDDRRLAGVSESSIDELVDSGVLECDGDRLRFDPGALEVAYPSDGDLRYDPTGDRYLSTLRSEFGESEGTVQCTDSISDRADPDNPRFSERAFTAAGSRVLFLLSELYFGGTPKMRRREIEHQFRDEAYPHFLSSGPTMELGVDIGALDALLLNGTPPNMNAYLQRIGRAGRSSNSSLVHSVSQRNPIDYYYYEEPTELITADKQPVPLNEHNEQVLKISLTWAILDYVAMTYTIPWTVTRHNVSGGEEVQLKAEASEDVRAEAGKFTQLLGRSVDELGLATERSRLRPLGTVVEDDEEGIREYLRDILDYTYCTDCARRSDTSDETVECPDSECSGRLVDAAEEHGQLIDEAIAAVKDVYIDGFRYKIDQIDGQIQGHEQRVELLDEAVRDAEEPERRRIQTEREQLSERIDVLERYKRNLTSESFYTVLDEVFGEYAFNLRSVSDTVDIKVVDETGDPERIGGDNGGRASRLALTEVHPYAAYLHERRPHVVSKVFTDDKRSEDIRESVANADSEHDEDGLTAIEYVCQDCGVVNDTIDADCDCSAQSEYVERRLFALDTVEATLDTELLPNDRDEASTIYDRSGDRIQNTFALRETEILSFEPNQQFRLQSDQGDHVGTLSFGSYDILEYTDSCRAKYQTGAIDEGSMTFRLCDEPDCPGVVYSDDHDRRRCSVNAEHEPDDGSDTVLGRMGYEYETEGVRIVLDDHDIDVTHSIGHGLRLGLQKLSGVTIRDINEYVGTDHVDIFDAQEGGAAVCRTLVRSQDDAYRNYETAISLMERQFDCECDDGCPRCLYQYGCARRNDPNSLTRSRVRDLLNAGLELVPCSEQS